MKFTFNYYFFISSIFSPKESPIINPIRARLIAGTQEGELVLLDETTGEYDRTISVSCE